MLNNIELIDKSGLSPILKEKKYFLDQDNKNTFEQFINNDTLISN